MSLDSAISIIDLYRSIDAFPSEPGIPFEEFDDWSAMLVRCGVMPADVAADGLLDFANSAQGAPAGGVPIAAARLTRVSL